MPEKKLLIAKALMVVDISVAAAIFMILFLHMYWGPDIFFIEFTTNLHHVNGFLCYYDIIHGFELFQLRGK